MFLCCFVSRVVGLFGEAVLEVVTFVKLDRSNVTKFYFVTHTRWVERSLRVVFKISSKTNYQVSDIRYCPRQCFKSKRSNLLE
jgi:hypothetical protein